jgi:hypothetical protein
VIATCIESLPDEGDPQRSSEERIAKSVGLAAYGGTWCALFNLVRPADYYFMRTVSGGADTVSKRNENILYH